MTEELNSPRPVEETAKSGHVYTMCEDREQSGAQGSNTLRQFKLFRDQINRMSPEKPTIKQNTQKKWRWATGQLKKIKPLNQSKCETVHERHQDAPVILNYIHTSQHRAKRRGCTPKQDSRAQIICTEAPRSDWTLVDDWIQPDGESVHQSEGEITSSALLIIPSIPLRKACCVDKEPFSWKMILKIHPLSLIWEEDRPFLLRCSYQI